MGDHFIYHREAQSFPGPMRRLLPQKQAPPSALQVKWRSFRRYIMPGGSNGAVGVAFGFGLPVMGTIVLVSFIYSATQDNSRQYAQVQEKIEYNQKLTEEARV